MKEKDIGSLEHTRWRCQYHVVFAPKYRRLAIYGEIKADIGMILRKLCEQKGIDIIEAQACPDHLHMLLSIPPKMSVAYAIGYLKGKSSLMIFDRHANLKYKYGNRHLTLVGLKLCLIDLRIPGSAAGQVCFVFRKDCLSGLHSSPSDLSQ